MMDFFRDPALTGIVSVLTLLAYLYVEREKLLPIGGRRYAFMFFTSALFGSIFGATLALIGYTSEIYDDLLIGVFGQTGIAAIFQILGHLLIGGTIIYGAFRIVSAVFSGLTIREEMKFHSLPSPLSRVAMGFVVLSGELLGVFGSMFLIITILGK